MSELIQIQIPIRLGTALPPFLNGRYQSGIPACGLLDLSNLICISFSVGTYSVVLLQLVVPHAGDKCVHVCNVQKYCLSFEMFCLVLRSEIASFGI